MSETPETSKGDAIAVERAIAGAVELPLLTRGNYHEWSLVIKVGLEALGLWHAVETDKVERRDDRMALAAILRGVPSELKAVLAVKATAKEAWAAVKTMRVGEDRVKVANKQRLMKEFENMAFRDGERIDDFAVRINGIVGGLRELGEEIKDGRVVRKVLRMVPKKWKQVAVSIEMLLDLDKMTIEELVGRLRVAEQADDEDAAAAAEVGRLYLTEEQWEARHRQRIKEQRRAGDARRGSGGGDGRRGGGSGYRGNGGRGDDDDGSDGDDEASSMCSRQCHCPVRERRSSEREDVGNRGRRWRLREGETGALGDFSRLRPIRQGERGGSEGSRIRLRAAGHGAGGRRGAVLRPSTPRRVPAPDVQPRVRASRDLRASVIPPLKLELSINPRSLKSINIFEFIPFDSQQDEHEQRHGRMAH